MPAKHRPNVNNIDRFRLERIAGGLPELVGAVLVGVDVGGVVRCRRSEEEEDARIEI